MAESAEELKRFLMKVKEESGKVGLKLNIQKTNIMASGPITSWEIVGKQWKQCQTLFWGAPKSLEMVIAAIKRNTFEPVLMRWMNLEPIIQTEVSQKEKDKYHILTHIYMETRKMVLKNSFTGQQRRNRHRE